MPSNHVILCHPLLLLPSVFPSIRIFSHESALHIRWPKYWSLSFSISSSNEYSGLISFRIDWFDLLKCSRDSQESSPTPQFKSINSLALNLLILNILRQKIENKNWNAGQLKVCQLNSLQIFWQPKRLSFGVRMNQNQDHRGTAYGLILNHLNSLNWKKKSISILLLESYQKHCKSCLGSGSITNAHSVSIFFKKVSGLKNNNNNNWAQEQKTPLTKQSKTKQQKN